MESKDTLVVNLIAGSGAGKSTNAARIFTILKDMGVEVELVTEYVKSMVWEGRNKIFECQPYIFGKQLYRLVQVQGKVDVIITDRPICLDMIYDPEQDEDFRRYSLKQFNKFNNLNVYLNRKKKFNPNGRNEKSIDQAREVDNKILKALDNNLIPYIIADGNEEGCKEIVEAIISRLILSGLYEMQGV
ncbi:MAG: AAA family ATPase [Peptostreptococcaceae bacterium]